MKMLPFIAWFQFIRAGAQMVSYTPSESTSFAIRRKPLQIKGSQFRVRIQTVFLTGKASD